MITLPELDNKHEYEYKKMLSFIKKYNKCVYIIHDFSSSIIEPFVIVNIKNHRQVVFKVNRASSDDMIKEFEESLIMYLLLNVGD